MSLTSIVSFTTVGIPVTGAAKLNDLVGLPVSWLKQYTPPISDLKYTSPKTKQTLSFQPVELIHEDAGNSLFQSLLPEVKS